MIMWCAAHAARFLKQQQRMEHMKIFRFVITITIGLCLMGQAAWGAENRYVTDSFKVTLRTGPSIQNKIVIMLRSAQPLEVMETKDDWSHVRVLNRENDIEGWVLSRYLITRRPWEQQAGSLGQENTQLKGKLARIEKEWRETGGREREAAKGLKEKSRSLDELQNKYEALKRGSANYLKFKTEFDATKKTLITSQKKVENLTRENDILRASQRHKWFGMGGLVLLCGLLIGLIMGRHQKKQKSAILFD
ncbi:MAG: TIGR04211 family SH3 domain-containing protein [Deltaproteobacteria bacterium]|nr:TIGR04211 family SH3 domain-containing protein [Deltaproteobacteria bacterium]